MTAEGRQGRIPAGPGRQARPWTPRWARYLAATAIAAIGAVAGVASFASSVSRQAPQIALGAWPISGVALERTSSLALAKAVINPQQGLPPNLPAEIRKSAESALRYEPASAVAARNLAYYHASRGNAKVAFGLMDTALRMTRRNAGTNLWLVEHYGRQGDVRRALALYDMTIRTDTAAAGLIMRTMAQALRQPGAVPLFEQFLSNSPPWIDDFWTTVLGGDGDLQAPFELRLALHKRNIAMEPEHDQLLIEKLANTNHLNEAFALYRQIASRKAGAELLADPSFDARRSFPPIGWKVVAESMYGSSIDTAAGVLEVNALPGAEGVIGQQLVALNSARALQIAANYEGSGRTPLVVNIDCADSGSQMEVEVPISPGARTLATLPAPCQFAWVSLKLPRDDDIEGRSLRVSSVSIRPASRASQ